MSIPNPPICHPYDWVMQNYPVANKSQDQLHLPVYYCSKQHVAT